MAETWVIKDNVPVDEDSYVLNRTNVLFTSCGKEFIAVEILDDGAVVLGLTYYGSDGKVVQPAFLSYGDGETQFYWNEPAYKTLEFDTAPTGEFLTWLTKNADKQSDTEYLTRKSELTLVANAIRTKTGSAAQISFPDGYVTEISTLTNTSDATAASSDIVQGKTAYVKGAKVTGELSHYSIIDVGSEYQLAIPYRTQDSFMVEGLCSVSWNTIIDGSTRARTYIAIPGDATPDNVLEGATFSSSEGIEVTGTMPDNGAADIQLSNLGIVDVAEGYYSGGTARIADAEAAKIIPENIKKGVTIFGVPGKMEASAGGDYNIAAATNADGTQNLAITDAAGGGGGGGSGSRPPVSLTITVDPTGAQDGWLVDVYGPSGSLFNFDANNLTASIPDCTAGDVFVVSTSYDPTGKGYIDSDSTVCVNCYFDITGFGPDYAAGKAGFAVYACQIDANLSAGAEATMTIKFN